MNRLSVTSVTCVFLLAALLSGAGSSLAAGKLPPEKAGTIGEPTGRIAFVRDGNVWVMDHQGQNQMKVCEVTNADGRLSWAPDGKRIAFTRSGRLELRTPDMGGGKHKLYDLFIAFIDSAMTGNLFWWNRLTDNLGSRNPEWTADGQILFTGDMNANRADAAMPNYQICLMNPDSTEVVILREDWQTMPEFFMMPSINSKGDIAFVHFYGNKTQGIAVLPRTKFMTPLDSVKLQSIKQPNAVSPAWSPDDRWIAYINNSLDESGIYIATPDLSESYLVFTPPAGTYPYTVAPSFSPDSKWLTFSTTDGSIWICDITGQQPRRLSGPGFDSTPAWSKAPKK